MAPFPLISNCSALWDSEKAIEARVLSKRPPCPGAHRTLCGINGSRFLTIKSSPIDREHGLEDCSADLLLNQTRGVSGRGSVYDPSSQSGLVGA